MGKPPERRFQPADDDGHVSVGLADAVAVDDGGTVRPQSRLASGGVEILAPAFFGGGVVGHHGVDIAGADQKAQPRPAEFFEIVGGAPVRLGEHGDEKSVLLQHPGDDGRAEGRMIHISVAGDVDKIGYLPTGFADFFGSYGQKWMGHKSVLRLGNFGFQNVFHTVSRWGKDFPGNPRGCGKVEKFCGKLRVNVRMP